MIHSLVRISKQLNGDPGGSAESSRPAVATSRGAIDDGPLEVLRRKPTCETRDCDVRALRVGFRSVISQIVGPGDAGNLYNDTTPLHRTLAGMAGYICAACWQASMGPGVTMDARQPVCRKALVVYANTLLDMHHKAPIPSLPAFLRAAFADMTEAPVPDDLLAELRALARLGESCDR